MFDIAAPKNMIVIGVKKAIKHKLKIGCLRFRMKQLTATNGNSTRRLSKHRGYPKGCVSTRVMLGGVFTEDTIIVDVLSAITESVNRKSTHKASFLTLVSTYLSVF